MYSVLLFQCFYAAIIPAAGTIKPVYFMYVDPCTACSLVVSDVKLFDIRQVRQI